MEICNLDMKSEYLLKKSAWLLLTILITFIIYSPSLNREWQFFDERLITNEGLFPIAINTQEVFEIIKTYAFSYHSDYQNAFFSNLIITRYTNIIGAILNILILYFFKTNGFYYHLLGVLTHVFSTIIIWLIFYKLLSYFEIKKYINIATTLLTLTWSLHPANVESVEIATNWTVILTYSFLFVFFLYSIDKILKGNYKYQALETILVSLFYFLSLLINEHGSSLAFILFFVSLSLPFPSTENQTIKLRLINSLKTCTPYIFGLIYFTFYYSLTLLSQTLKHLSTISHATNHLYERFSLVSLVYFFIF